MTDNKSSQPSPQAICAVLILAFMLIGAALYVTYDVLWRAAQRRLAEKKCQEYERVACDNPRPQSPQEQIIQGENVPFLGLYPHMAFVQIEHSKGHGSCGGSLISENFILSAAHCVYGFRFLGPKITIKLGSLNNNMTNSSGELYNVRHFQWHPSYSEKDNLYDFLLLELDRKVAFTSNVRPICLNTNYDKNKYNRVIATGWGRTENGTVSPTLRVVELTTRDGGIDKLCNDVTELDYPWYWFFICAGFPNASKSVKQGDSGGPLQVLKESECANVFEEIGVTSMVQDRPYDANRPLLSFYSITASSVPWIANIVWRS